MITGPTIGKPSLFYCKPDTLFPNSRLPVILYRGALRLPSFFKSLHLRRLFAGNNWTNAWDSGIFTYDHYHSTTHEVLGIYKGSTTLQLGGASGVQLVIRKGDVLVIPAGVAHRNLGKEHQIKCVGAYPDGRKYDIKTGRPGEREEADRNISELPVPEQDPAFGRGVGVPLIWRTPELYQTSQVVGF